MGQDERIRFGHAEVRLENRGDRPESFEIIALIRVEIQTRDIAGQILEAEHQRLGTASLHVFGNHDASIERESLEIVERIRNRILHLESGTYHLIELACGTMHEMN